MWPRAPYTNAVGQIMWCHILISVLFCAILYANKQFSCSFVPSTHQILAMPLTDSISTVAQSSAWHSLWSAMTSADVKPCTRTRSDEREHGFCFAGPGPVVWNRLPSHLHCITDTSFKRKLKTKLFRQAFNYWLTVNILLVLLADCV